MFYKRPWHYADIEPKHLERSDGDTRCRFVSHSLIIQTTRDNSILYYKFEASGEGRIISPDTFPKTSDDDWTYIAFSDIFHSTGESR